MKQQILVACIGNIFFGDDGFGSEVACALRQSSLPANVKLVDYGIRSLDLAYALLEPWSAVILVDAVARGGEPGTLYILRPDTDEIPQNTAIDAHALDPIAVLKCARSLGNVSPEIYFVACEPLDLGDDLEGRMGLSPEIAIAVPEAARMVMELISKLSAEVEPARL